MRRHRLAQAAVAVMASGGGNQRCSCNNPQKGGEEGRGKWGALPGADSNSVGGKRTELTCVWGQTVPLLS